MQPVLKIVLICCLALLTACGQGPSVDERVDAARDRNDGPPIWVVKDADSTLYLYGTLHLLPPDTLWQRDDLSRIFAQSGTVFFESRSDISAQRRGDIYVAANGLYGVGGTITSMMSGYEQKLFTASALTVGLPEAALEGYKPWVVADVLSLAQLSNAGFDAQYAVDEALKRQADADGKFVVYLETIEQSLSTMADLNPSLQRKWLVNVMKGLNDQPETMRRVVKAWVAGDVASLEKSLIGAMTASDAEFYDVIITRRNRKWMGELTAFLETDGTGVAAIGISHLIGEGSLQSLLRQKGYSVERYYDYIGDPVIKPLDLDISPDAGQDPLLGNGETQEDVSNGE